MAIWIYAIIVTIVLLLYIYTTCRFIKSRDTALRNVTEQLSNANDTINRVTKTVGKISAGLSTNTTELGDIIKRLKAIAVQVQDLENNLSDYNTYYGMSNSNNDI